MSTTLLPTAQPDDQIVRAVLPGVLLAVLTLRRPFGARPMSAQPPTVHGDRRG